MNMPSLAPAAAPKSTSWPGDDFPAWISPMLVKELRQGVQSGAFAWTFILLQVAMFVLMTFWVVNRSDGFGSRLEVNQLFHGFFWSLFGFAAAVILPVRAAGSMTAERVGNTLDLLRLTHLSSTQIVVGKWLAVMAQVLLIATAVLPYLVLQYFFGGLDIVADLFSFVVVLLVAAVMTAVSLAAAGQSPLTRGLLTAFFFFAVPNFLGLFGSVLGTAALSPWSAIPAILVVAALLTAVMLVYSAAAIAPPAENHACRVRILALVATGLAMAAGAWFGPISAAFVIAVTVLLVAGIAIAELTSDPVELASIHAPFARLGLFGRLAAMVLTPGWATAICFTLLAAPFLGLAVFSGFPGLPATARIPEKFVLGVAAILFPLSLMLRFPAGKQRRMVFIGVQIFPVFIFCLQAPLGLSNTPAAEIFGALTNLLPLAALLNLFFQEGSGRGFEPMSALALGVTALSLVFVVPRFLRELAAVDRRVTAARTIPTMPHRSLPA
ncbi:MAG: hypothetical protein WCJ31_06130 [Planctomycetia bacterium]